VRIDKIHAWKLGDRTVLALLYYAGADAEEDFICGQCHVAPLVAIVERSGDGLALVAKGPDPWHPEADMALFDGRADFNEDIAFARESLLAVEIPWSHGMIGARSVLMLYALDGDRLHVVFESDWSWHASGMGKEDDDLVDTRFRFVPAPGRKDDLELTMTEKRCHDDAEDAEMKPVCGRERVVKSARYRAEADGYHRTAGGPMPLPGVLHRVWGW
jgi:hypothetical protein